MSPLVEIITLGMEPCDSATSAIKARLVSPSASNFVVSRVPLRVHADRPLELELTAVGLGAGAGVAVSIASWISAHARLVIAVSMPGQRRGVKSVPVTARPSGGSWIIRALARPSAWADAVSVTVVSFSLAGRPLTCDILPVTLRMGFSHAKTPAGAVLKAAKAGDGPALWAAIEAGGSTEEAEAVRWEVNIGVKEMRARLRAPPYIPAYAGRLDCLDLGRKQRPPRGPPHSPGGRR